jgi:hypothetical protein
LRYLLIVIIGCFVQLLSAQSVREKVPSYFGIQLRPLIPGDFLGRSELILQQGTFKTTVSQRMGYSFGASVRVGLTDLISLETGISQVKRNYDLSFEYVDSNLFATNTLSILNYDIPLNALIYIRLSDKIYMNGSLGMSMMISPSNVGKSSEPSTNGAHRFILEGRRYGRFIPELNANIGFELRTEKNGIFYIGGTGKVPFKAIYQLAGVYEFQSSNQKIIVVGDLIGTYLALDFRYYFPHVKKKGIQFIPGPIEQ